jgi:hypothetical protein
MSADDMGGSVPTGRALDAAKPHVLVQRPAAALHLGRFAALRAWYRELRKVWAAASTEHETHRARLRLVDTSDDGMIEMLARTIVLQPGARWERAAVRATVGIHATRHRDARETGEQGLARFKLLLERALPPASVRTAEQSRVAKEMVRWWVEAYYEVDA